MDQDRSSQKKLIESFWPPSLRLAWAAAGKRACAASTDMVLLWLDIVGSTRLANSLIESGEAGIEQLGSLLERHFDTLIKIVVAHGGQPLMFAGDGLLSGWPCAFWTAREAALRAAQCADDLLSREATRDLEGRPLQLHAVLAFGSCRTIEIAAYAEPIYVTVGEALRDLQVATKLRAAGQLLVSAAARAILGPEMQITPALQGCGILIGIRERLPPAPLMLPPLPESMDPWLRAHAPSQMRLDSDQRDWAVELRRVTALFGALPDVNRATGDIERRLEEVVQILMPCARRHDGLFYEMCVDDKGANVLVLFGAPPVAHANDSVLGVRMAIDLRDALRSIGCRSMIGVATGHALCGWIGNDTFRKYMVYGDVINLASGLQALSRGAIVCDEATMRRSCGVMTFDPCGHTQVKGIASPVPLWMPRRQDKLEALIPMHGREAELETLVLALRATAQGKKPNVVVVEGETGMGKSRLLAEFRKRVAANEAHILMGSADRIERQVPYHAWRGIYEQLLGIAGLDDIEVRRERVLKALGAERADQGWLLNAVLTLEFPSSPRLLSVSDEQRARARLSLMLSLLREAAEHAMLALIIDDAHWMDEASWELAHHVATELQGLCLFVSMQPLEDDTPLARLVAYGATRLTLSELSDSEQERLICARLGVARVTEDVTTLIGNRARGHPFFCIELAQALVEDGILEVVDGECHIADRVSLSKLPLPDTVHGAVTRRIDRLADGPKLALKVASAAGMRFPTSLVQDVYPIANEQLLVRQHLASNNRIGLLAPDRVDEMEGYAFQHGIIRDVTYGLMLHDKRKQLHLNIATWYERTFADQLSRYYALLSHHLESAHDFDRAAHYQLLEAERSFSLGLARQSVTGGVRAAELLGVILPTNADGIRRDLGRERERIHALLAGRRPAELITVPARDRDKVDNLLELLIRIAPLAFQSGQVELYDLIITTAMRHTLEHGNGPKAAEVYSLYSVVVGGFLGDRTEKAAWSRLALDLLKGTRDKRFGPVAFVHGWFHNHWVGPLADQAEYLRGSVELSRAGADAALSHEDILYGSYNLAACVIYLAAAGRTLKEVMQTARTHLDRIGGRVMNASFHIKLELQMAKALAGLTQGWLDLTDHEFDEARDIASIRETELHNQTGFYHVSRAKLHVHFGDWRGALEWIEQARQLLPFFQGQVAECELEQFHGLAALAEVAFGQSGEDRTLKEDGRDRVDTLREWERKAPGTSMFGHKADLLEGVMECFSDPTEKAAQLLKQSAQAAMAAGFLHDTVLALEFLARCYRKAGQPEKASRALEEALNTCNRWGADAKLAFLKKEFGYDMASVKRRPSRARERAHACRGRAPEGVRRG
jgi:predicted ATPase